MRYDDRKRQFQLVPLTGGCGINSRRRWFNQIMMHRTQSILHCKPDWVHLPDRVWHRNSALLMSLHERKRIDG